MVDGCHELGTEFFIYLGLPFALACADHYAEIQASIEMEGARWAYISEWGSFPKLMRIAPADAG
jgi:hypothetical protein